ncbi:uncharacterized protein LOC144702124 [Wolffia australiana]
MEKSENPRMDREELATFSQVLFPVVPEVVKFNGFNLLDWSQYIELILESKGLVHHLKEEIDPESPKYRAWKKEDAGVHAWLLGSMAGDRFRKYLYLKTAKSIWDHLHKSNVRESHAWRIFELVTRATILVQGEMSAAEFAEELQAIWREIDHLRPIKNPEEWQATLQDRMFRFLMGLNKEYEGLRSQILNREHIPDLEEAIQLVIDEERRRAYRNDKEETGAGFMVKTKQQQKSTSEGQFLKYQKKQGDEAPEQKGHGSKQQGKFNLYCSYCKRKNHTKDNCWILHGRPPKPAQAYVSDARESESDDEAEQGQAPNKTSSKITAEDYATLKEEFEKLKTMISSTSMARAVTEPEDFTF